MGPTPSMRRVAAVLAAIAAMAFVARPACSAARGAKPEPRLSALDRAHAEALDSFRRARFSEAYGRFIKLAELGHAASARYAIWMCENGTALFGVMWDCAPQELEDWGAVARTASVPTTIAPPARRR